MCSLTDRPTAQLATEIRQLAAQVSALTCRWLELVAEFDRREAWGPEGMSSTVDWLAWQCALTRSAARDHVRVARSFARLPRMHQSFRRGELSYSKVRALSRLEQVAFEEELLALARDATAAQLERIVADHRTVVRLEADRERTRAGRYVRLLHQPDGSVRLSGVLAAEEAAVLEKAMDQARRVLWARERSDAGEDVPEDPRDWDMEDRPRTSTADALLLLADASLARDVDRASAERHQVVVHVDAAALQAARDHVPPEPAAESTAPTTGSTTPARLQGGGALAPSLVRRLCCDATLTTMLEQGGRTLDVGRRTRTIPAALRRALEHRDGTCRFPGCQASRLLDAHHVSHWLDGGATSAENLVLLCRRHHGALHEGGFRLTVDEHGTLRFVRPDGSPLAGTPPQPCADERTRAPQRRLSRRGLAYGSGRPYDHPDAVEAFLRLAPPPAPPPSSAPEVPGC